MKSGQAGQSGAKRGKVEPSGAKRGQMVPNRVKRGLNGAKKGLTEPNAKRGQKGEMGPNEAKLGQMRLIFCMYAYFYEIKNHV